MSRKTDNRIKNYGAYEVYDVMHFNKEDRYFIQVTIFSKLLEQLENRESIIPEENIYLNNSERTFRHK